MRKVCFSLVLASTILLMVSLSFAQSPRQPVSSDGKTTFTNIAVMGFDKDGTDGTAKAGVPGYIEMTSTKGDVYYLYIGYDGKLRVVSDITIGLDASPNTTSWSDASGRVIGLQDLED